MIENAEAGHKLAMEKVWMRVPNSAQPIVDHVDALRSEVARLTAERKPNVFWLYDDPESGMNDEQELADRIEVGEVACVMVGHMLPNQWAANVRIPATETHDEESEIQLFATEAEARADLSTTEDTP